LLLPLLFPDFALILQTLLRREGFMMLRRTLLVSGLILASTLGLANSAKAVDYEVDVPFEGTVASNCSFGTVVPGTLGLNGTGNALDSKATTGGLSGTVPLSCNGGATVKVMVPVDGTATPNPTSTTNKGFITVGTKPQIDSDNTTGVSLAAGDFTSAQTVTVDMTASVASGSSFVSGTHKYKVKVVATPGT
jgi:hypothetical protein